MSILSHSAQNESTNTKDKLHEASTDIAHEFKCFVNDVECMIKETASLTGEDLARAKIKLNQRIHTAKQSVSHATDTLLNQARNTAERTNNYVHEKPWTIIGAGALASFALGMLLSRK